MEKRKNILIIVGVILFCAVFVGAILLYNNLSKDYDFSEGQNTDDPAKTPDANATADEGGEVVFADDFTVYDSNGNAVKLSDLRGKPVVVNFWASWCGPCKAEMPLFDAAYRQFGDQVVFMMVNLTDGYTDTPETAAEFADACGYVFPIYHDLERKAAAAYSVGSIPMTLFINPDGSLESTVIGAMNEPTFASKLNSIME